MFRYVAIVWNPSKPEPSALADRLGEAWIAQRDWDAALLRPGLQVYTHGAKPGVNEAIALPGGQGLVLGKLFRRAALGTAPPRHTTLTGKEGERILQSQGRSLVDEFWGRYIAFAQSASGTVQVLRDPSGTLPCFFIRHEGTTILFSWLEDALELLGDAAPRQVNWDALLYQMRRGAITGRATLLHGLHRVLPGERLDLHGQGSTLMWSAADFARTPATSTAEEATRMLKEQVRACTRAWASCYDTAMLRLSGGVDSSILLSCLAPGQTTADVIGINYHSPGSDTDERHYARLTAARVGRDLIERERDASFRIDRLGQVAQMPEPVYHIGWMNSASDTALASAYGASALITGAGGDSLFFEFARWWPAADYLRVRGLDAGFAAAAMDAARLGKTSVWRTMALALRERLRPSIGAADYSAYTALFAENVLSDCDSPSFAHPAVAGAMDLPIGKYNQMLGLTFPLGYYDPFAKESGPELVNPLFSQPLVELCLGLPTYLLVQGGRGRALARRAFRDDLPPQITNRRSKGGMEEHIRAVLLSNIDVIRPMLLEGQLAARGLIDRPRIEALLSGRPTALAGPNSQMHAMVAVEAWLARWPG